MGVYKEKTYTEKGRVHQRIKGGDKWRLCITVRTCGAGAALMAEGEHTAAERMLIITRRTKFSSCPLQSNQETACIAISTSLQQNFCVTCATEFHSLYELLPDFERCLLITYIIIRKVSNCHYTIHLGFSTLCLSTYFFQM